MLHYGQAYKKTCNLIVESPRKFVFCENVLCNTSNWWFSSEFKETKDHGFEAVECLAINALYCNCIATVLLLVCTLEIVKMLLRLLVMGKMCVCVMCSEC